CERLRNRPQKVMIHRSHVRVTLVDDVAAVNHDEAVARGPLQEVVELQLSESGGSGLDPAHLAARRRIESSDRARPADDGGGKELVGAYQRVAGVVVIG